MMLNMLELCSSPLLRKSESSRIARRPTKRSAALALYIAREFFVCLRLAALFVLQRQSKVVRLWPRYYRSLSKHDAVAQTMSLP